MQIIHNGQSQCKPIHAEMLHLGTVQNYWLLPWLDQLHKVTKSCKKVL